MKFALKGSVFLELLNLKIGKILRFDPLTWLQTPNCRLPNLDTPIFVGGSINISAAIKNLLPEL
jgi:hypothetical protein